MSSRLKFICVAIFAVLALSACGKKSSFANLPRPADVSAAKEGEDPKATPTEKPDRPIFLDKLL